MNPHPLLLIFDLDGTLIDSKKDIVLCVNRALIHQDMPAQNEETISDLIGRGATYLFQQLLNNSVSSSEIESLVGHFKNFYSRHLLDHTKAYPGVQETLTFFPKLPKVVVTNKNQEFADQLLNKLNLKHHFEAVFGSEAFSTQKPDGGPILKVCEMWGVEPAHAAIIGDSVFDILAGRDAGAKTVAALYGFSNPDELRRLLPDYEIEKVHDLTKIFMQPICLSE